MMMLRGLGDQRWLKRDRDWARLAHRYSSHPKLLRCWLLASRVGDGMLWFGLMLGLPLLDHLRGPLVAQQMVELGLVNLTLYLALKRIVGRPRPYAECSDIRICTRSVDTFSFPSGHTLHAVSYAILLGWHYPLFSTPLWSLALLVASSRVTLGLHYLSDVMVGAGIGALTAGAALWLVL
jgi:undecaprenyl-diphosphatase